MRKPGRFAAIVAVGATVALMVAGAASAGLIFRDTIHEEETFVIDDFCGAGLTVRDEFAIDLRVQAVSKGRDGLAYFLQHGQIVDHFTNLANGKTVTGVVGPVLEKDQRVTDNGNGTLTILILATGNAVLYDESGTAIARDPGQVRFEILVDDNGTPTDPFDDEFIADLGVVKESTGRSDDFCEAAVAALS
jgi:hypothetical protein